MSAENQKKKTKTITISTQKGGGGKTDTSLNTAGGLINYFAKLFIDKTACVLDIDPQHTASEVWATNKNPSFPVIKFDEDEQAGITLQSKVKDLYGHYDYIIIDCPPTAEKNINKSNVSRLVNVAYWVSNLVIIPVPLTKVDILASVKTQLLLKHVIKGIEEKNKDRDVKRKLEVRILINKYDKGGVLTKKWEPVLRNKAIFPIFNTTIGDRVAHAKACDNGESVLKTNDYKAKAELQELISEIVNIIGE